VETANSVRFRQLILLHFDQTSPARSIPADVKRLARFRFGQQLLQSSILSSRFLQMLRLIGANSTVLPAPTIVRLIHHIDLTAGFCSRHSAEKEAPQHR